LSNEKKQRVKLLTAKQARDQGKPTFAPKYNLKETREWVGISQAELARKSGIPKAAIANVESNRYKMSVLNGAVLFMAFASSIPPEFPAYRKKMRQEAFRLLGIQKELDSEELVDIDRQIERLQKKREAVKASVAELESKEARLRGED
jgi:DNA-binding XRE family transcriptional regulator